MIISRSIDSVFTKMRFISQYDSPDLGTLYGFSDTLIMIDNKSLKYDIFIRFGLAISAFLCILPLVIQACVWEFWQKKKVLRHVVNCVIVFPSLILTMWLGFKYMNPPDAYNEVSNSLVPISIYNSDGDVIQTFTGRLSSIKYGDGYVRYVDEDNVEHDIYLNDYALIGIGEVIE